MLLFIHLVSPTNWFELWMLPGFSGVEGEKHLSVHFLHAVYYFVSLHCVTIFKKNQEAPNIAAFPHKEVNHLIKLFFYGLSPVLPLGYIPQLTTENIEGKTTASTFVLDQPRCIFDNSVDSSKGIWLVVAKSDGT